MSNYTIQAENKKENVEIIEQEKLENVEKKDISREDIDRFENSVLFNVPYRETVTVLKDRFKVEFRTLKMSELSLIQKKVAESDAKIRAEEDTLIAKLNIALSVVNYIMHDPKTGKQNIILNDIGSIDERMSRIEEMNEKKFWLIYEAWGKEFQDKINKLQEAAKAGNF